MTFAVVGVICGCHAPLNKSDSMRVKVRIVALVIAVGLLYRGLGLGVPVAWTARETTMMTVADFQRSPSRPVWVQLTDGYLDLAEGLRFTTKLGDFIDGASHRLPTVEDAFLPLRPAVGGDGLIHVVVYSQDLELVSATNKFIRGEGAGDRIYKSVQGTVDGVPLEDDTIKKLKEVYGQSLSENFVILGHHKKPITLLGALLCLVFGLLALAVAICAHRIIP